MRRLELVVALVSVLVALSAALLTGRASPEIVQPAAQAEVVPLSSQTLGCPESPTGRQPATVAGVTLPSGRPPTGDDLVELIEVEDETQTAVASADVPGEVVRFEADRDLPSVMVSARGSLAAGVSGAVYVETATDVRRGLEGVRCEAPQDQWWFAGIDTSPSATSRLVLVNPTPAVSVVSLHVSGPNGLVPTPGAQGIPVGGRTSQVIDLAGYVPGLEVASLQVEATRGLIVAAVQVQRFTATSSVGSDWIPPAHGSATDVMVEPTASGAATRTLVVTNPGAREALVQGRVLDEDGAFNPQELADLRIEPGATRTVRLDELAPRSAVAVRLTSNVPVVAGTLTQAGGGARSDLSFSAASTPLAGSAALAAPSRADLAVLLATLRAGGGRVEVAWHSRSGDELGSEVIALSGAGVRVWALPRRQPARTAYVVVTPRGESSVHAVLAASGDASLTTIPLRAGARTLTRPGLAPAEP